MKIREAVARIQVALSAPDPAPDLEGLIVGDAAAELNGITTCFAPSMAVMRNAVAKGHNLILCDAHPLFSYDVLGSQLGDTQARLNGSAIVQAKRRFMADNQLAVFRMRTAWNTAMPSAGAQAMADALGFGGAAATSGDGAINTVSPRKIADILHGISTRGVDGVRLMGRSDRMVKHIAFANGMVSVPRAQKLLSDPAIDLVIAGEVKEWEGGPYFEDAIAMGRLAGLVLTGLAPSMTPQATLMAALVSRTLPKVAVTAAAAITPLIWTPRTAA